MTAPEGQRKPAGGAAAPPVAMPLAVLFSRSRRVPISPPSSTPPTSTSGAIATGRSRSTAVVGGSTMRPDSSGPSFCGSTANDRPPESRMTLCAPSWRFVPVRLTKRTITLFCA